LGHPLKGQKFAGWEGRFTPAQDSQPFILDCRFNVEWPGILSG
jgi:hypothetical protein